VAHASRLANESTTLTAMESTTQVLPHTHINAISSFIEAVLFLDNSNGVVKTNT